MDVSDGPHQVSGGDPLTSWDWLEESFLLESRLTGTPVPSHLEMLERLGVLTDEPRPPAPPPLSPKVGLRADHPSGAWLQVDKPDWIEVFVPPSFSVVIRQRFELWGAWVPDAPLSSGEWIVEPEFPDWRHAASEAARTIAVNYGQREGDAVCELALVAGGDAGEAVPKPPEPAGPSAPVVYPTIEFTAYNIVDIELTPNLLLQFREPWDSKGWYGRVAHEALAPMDDVVPGPHATWHDAARAMVEWLTDNQDGQGVPELEQIIHRHPSGPA